VAKASNTYLIPQEVDSKSAAALLETYATAIYALKDRAMLAAGETLVVLGAAGGTGTAAIQIGKQFGAKVIACVSSDEKAAFCLANGADMTINYVNTDLKSELKKLGSVDVVFDPVGGDLSESAFRSLMPNGRHLVVGFASGVIPALSWNLPLLKSASIIGVFWGHFWRNFPLDNARNVRLLLKWLEQEKISPAITKVLPLALGVEALLEISNRMVKGKIVLEI
jgi:NADPH2:quinone reductase